MINLLDPDFLPTYFNWVKCFTHEAFGSEVNRTTVRHLWPYSFQLSMWACIAPGFILWRTWTSQNITVDSCLCPVCKAHWEMTYAIHMHFDLFNLWSPSHSVSAFSSTDAAQLTAACHYSPLRPSVTAAHTWPKPSGMMKDSLFHSFPRYNGRRCYLCSWNRAELYYCGCLIPRGGPLATVRR